LALLLAVMGVYAQVAHSVGRRGKEFAIRMTLGARTADLWRLVLGEGLRPVAVGMILGLAAAFAAGRLLASLLFEVSPANPIVFAAVAASVLVAGAAACILPGRRAAYGKPLAALRAE
jgi:ABC-type antimicrobial peptide transport system permease subunit